MLQAQQPITVHVDYYTVRYHSFINKKSLTIMVCVICFGLFCILGQIPNISSPGLYSEGLIIGGFFAFRICGEGAGACIRRGLYLEGLIFGILRYPSKRRELRKRSVAELF